MVAKDLYTVPEDPDILDEEAEGYKFSRHIELPKSLTKCVQDLETRGIKIRHKLKFNILLHNPDDHTSELRATLPVSLYISPSLAINDNNELVDQSPVAARRAIENELTHQAPPLYGDHQLDQMYSDLDSSGYRTPGNFSTPGTPFGTHSRNVSSENLSLIDTNTAADTAAGPNLVRPADIPAAALRHRLQNLRSAPTPLTGEGSSVNTEIIPEASSRVSAMTSIYGEHVSSGMSSRRSHSRSSPNRSRSVTPGQDHSSRESPTNLSRRTSDEDYTHLPSGTQTPGPQYLEVEYLSRVPPYSTAVRASARSPYSGSDLPSYGAVTSANASLSSSPNAGPSNAMESPPAAHIRGQVAGPGSSPRDGAIFPARELHFPGRPSPSGNVHGRTIGDIQDEERRLRLMQARPRT